MNNTLRLNLFSVVVLTGCASTRIETITEMASEPLCDGSDALRFGYNLAGGQVESTYEFTNPFGWRFFAIDGKCHFYASRDEMEGVVTGVLSDADAQRLSAELHFDELPKSSASYGIGSCFDASGASVYTGTSSLSCLCSCEGAPEAASEAIEHADSWLDMLADSGEPLDGAIRGLAYLQGRLGSPYPKYEWPLEMPIDKIDGLLIQRGERLPEDAGVRFEGADADALRELRATSHADAKSAEAAGRNIETMLIEGPMETLEYKLFLQDELPDEAFSALKTLFNPR